jgi:stress response protein YsnF
VGEVDIAKTAEQRTARVTDTVRREEVTVDDEVIDSHDAPRR